MLNPNPVLVALDVPTLAEAVRLVEALRDEVGGFKVGLELCTSAGTPQVIEAISEAGGAVFVDLKLKDIPNTVAGATRALARPGVMMFNLHADGGVAMMAAARAALAGAEYRPLALAVTVLTSVDEAALNGETRVPGAVATQVVHLARLAQTAGMDGVVCSAHEVAAIKAACGAAFITVVPGMRPAWAAVGDQKRVMTPGAAVAAGADFLVIGRPITQPPAQIGSPVAAARLIREEITAAQATRGGYPLP